jgi:hypothetical protein
VAAPAAVVFGQRPAARRRFTAWTKTVVFECIHRAILVAKAESPIGSQPRGNEAARLLPAVMPSTARKKVSPATPFGQISVATVTGA